MVTLLCSFESGFLMPNLHNKFCKENKWHFSGDIQSHLNGPLSLHLEN